MAAQQKKPIKNKTKSPEYFRRQGRADAAVLLLRESLVTGEFRLKRICQVFDITPEDIYIAGDRLAKQRVIPVRPYSWEDFREIAHLISHKPHSDGTDKWCPVHGSYVPLYDPANGAENFYRTNSGDGWGPKCIEHTLQRRSEAYAKKIAARAAETAA